MLIKRIEKEKERNISRKDKGRKEQEGRERRERKGMSVKRIKNEK